MRFKGRRLATLILPVLLVSPPAAEGDELVIVTPEVLGTSPLPVGPARPGVLQLSEAVETIALLPDGRLLGLLTAPPSNAPSDITLVEIADGGEVVPLGNIELDPRGLFGEWPIDLAVDGDGRLHLLSFVSTFWNPPDGFPRLVRLDPANAATLASLDLAENAGPIAPAPRGFWAFGAVNLRHLDSSDGRFTDTGLRLPLLRTFAADTDSTGAVWAVWEGICSPPCFELFRFDPVTGSVRSATAELRGGLPVRDFAVRRDCVETAQAGCLQGGRFRAEVTWRDHEGNTGRGRLAPARSADSVLFWFFERSNWELQVKVLDGCGLGGFFWVFAAATTDVEYTLTVTDLETGASRAYHNPLGRASPAVTDTTAFACP